MEDFELSREQLIDRKLYQDIGFLLFVYDPIRICYQNNFDEYASEVGPIVSALKKFKDLDSLAKDIEAIFAKFFSPQIAAEFDQYPSLAKECYRCYDLASKLKSGELS